MIIFVFRIGHSNKLGLPGFKCSQIFQTLDMHNSCAQNYKLHTTFKCMTYKLARYVAIAYISKSKFIQTNKHLNVD